MGGEWRRTTIGEFCPFTYGKGLPERLRNPSGSVPCLGSNGVVGYHDMPLVESPAVVIGRKGTIGAVHYSPSPCWPIDTTFYITDSDTALLRFKYYLLKSLGLERMNADSAVPGLNREAAHALEVTVPPLPEQRAIARILGALDDRLAAKPGEKGGMRRVFDHLLKKLITGAWTVEEGERWLARITPIAEPLDDKIELNRRMSETLEAIARAIFQAWFVDFEPVRAKVEGRWRKGESLPGLPAHLWDLFPDRLVESEIGEVPEGWRVGSLSDIAHFLNGLALQKYPPASEDALPVIKIAQLRAGNTAGADRASVNLDPRYIVEDGDVLFSWSGSLECVVWTGGRGALNQHLFRVTSDKYPKWFYYFWIHEHLPEFRGIAADKATTMGHIQRYHLKTAKVTIASPGVIAACDTLATRLFDGVISLRIQSRTLAAIRDALLPKLLSGEIRVGDAEQLAGAQA